MPNVPSPRMIFGTVNDGTALPIKRQLLRSFSLTVS